MDDYAARLEYVTSNLLLGQFTLHVLHKVYIGNLWRHSTVGGSCSFFENDGHTSACTYIHCTCTSDRDPVSTFFVILMTNRIEQTTWLSEIISQVVLIVFLIHQFFQRLILLYMITNYEIKIIYRNLDFNSSFMYFQFLIFFLIRRNDLLIYNNTTTCTCFL